MDESPWQLISESYSPPNSLAQRLRDLRLARYDPDPEATCRLAVGFVVIAYSLQLRAMYPDHFEDRECPPTLSSASRLNTPTTGLLTVFPELELSTTMINPKTSVPIRITGRADWCFGYSGRSGCEGPFAIARKAIGKTNDTVQRFLTDGPRYVFMAIGNDGTVRASQPLLVLNTASRKSIFNFIVHILETAMKSTLNATPTKPGEERDKEIKEYKTEVWEQAYARITTPEILPADEDTTEFNYEFTL